MPLLNSHSNVENTCMIRKLMGIEKFGSKGGINGYSLERV